MSVPLVQGTLRYAYKVDKLQGDEMAIAEGVVYAASILPQLADCDKDDANIVYNNMMVDTRDTHFSDIKQAFERNYGCLGISGKLVGGLWNNSTSNYYPGEIPKSDCNDSPFRFVTKNIDGGRIVRSCSWVAKRVKWNRCKLHGVASTCPSTCDTCSQCWDSTMRFKFSWNGEEKMRNCKWVRNKATEERCNKIFGINDTCRNTYGTVSC